MSDQQPRHGYPAPAVSAEHLPTVPAGPAAEKPEDLIRVEDLARFDVRPGDVFVYQPRDRMPRSMVDELLARWREHFPDNELVFLPPGELSTVRPEAEVRYVLDTGQPPL
jgi:hypothetical protein